MLISDWSSDVCSSDLRRVARSAGSSAVIRSSPKSRSQTADDLLLQGEKSGRDPSEDTAQEYEGHVAQDAGLHLDFLHAVFHPFTTQDFERLVETVECRFGCCRCSPVCSPGWCSA